MLLNKGSKVFEIPLAAVFLRLRVQMYMPCISYSLPFYLFSIFVNVESGEAVDTMSTAELPVGIPVGGAVHVPDRHLSIV